MAGAVAGEGRRGVAGVLAPRQPVLGAPRLGVGAPHPEQRPDQPAVARAHAEQRAAAGRGGEPVEHRLDLVGGGVAGGDVGAALRGEPRRLGVAGVARPRLQVALRPTRAVDGQRHAEALAQRGAVGGVLGRRFAQAVVDVQRGRRPGDPRGEVEQADGVGAAREQHHDGRARPQQALLAEHRLDGCSACAHRRHPLGRARRNRISVPRRPPGEEQPELGGNSSGGTSPWRTQRRSVSGETSSLRATSA